MVLSWFGSDEELGGIHRHCFTCFNVKKCNKDADACIIKECSLGCGSLFHECKEEEHNLLCQLVEVDCINVSFGCSLTMARKDIVKHLPSCPASIVACTQEWNRWPLNCKERYKTVPFRQRNPRAERGQLDYELALRDQNVVSDFHKLPRKTKLALRNNLTRRFPALPLPQRTVRKSDFADYSLNSLKESIKFEVTDDTNLGISNTYGVAKMFLKNQELQAKRWKDDVDQAVLRTGQPVPKKYWEFPELERGNIHKHCAYCYKVDCNVRNKLLEKEDHDDEVWTQSCSIISCPSECGASFHHCKGFEHRMICPLFEEEGEYDWMLRDRAFKKKKNKAPPPLKRFPDLLAGPSVCLPVSKSSRKPIPPPPPPNLRSTMRFDIKVETVTRLQQKPRAMYTFLCGQELRRDQWEGHCKNVHSDIHGGLNNWIEARCPLANYGCSFSIRRLFPGSDARAKIVYSQDTMSFGIRPAQPDIKEDKGGKQLTDLPIELLYVIFNFLDSWSLSNLALVNNLLRGVVCSLLDEKGCVALQWERVNDDVGAKSKWVVGYKRWFFSNYFSPVKNWGFNADGEISEHLKSCPYNIKVTHRKPDVKSSEWKKMMEALSVKMKMKRDSEWFIS